MDYFKLFRKITPFGFKVEGISLRDIPSIEPENATEAEYKYNSDEVGILMVLSGVNSFSEKFTTEVRFSFPRINKEGFFYIGGTLYMIPCVGVHNSFKPFSNAEYVFKNKSEVLMEIVRDIFGTKNPAVPEHSFEVRSSSSPLNSLFYVSQKNYEFDDFAFQAAIYSRLATHPFVRLVEDTPLQKAAFKDSVILYPSTNNIDIGPYKWDSKMEYKLDPTSTSSSETINTVYQLCKGAKIVDGKIVNGSSRYCEFTLNNSRFINLTPKRAYLSRSTIMNSCSLAKGKEKYPFIQDNCLVETQNFITAVMDMGIHTFEDCIAISETASQKLEAKVTTRITRWVEELPIELNYGIGDIIQPGDILVKNVYEYIINMANVTNTKDSHTVFDILATELKESGEIVHIVFCRSMYGSTPGFKISWYIESRIPLRTGDKISCFSGFKGTVHILQDRDMPASENGPVDICISPLSLAKRGALSLLYEMAIDKIYKDQTDPLLADQLPITFKEASRKAGSLTQLFINGEKLPSQTYSGMVPWIRIYKSGIVARRVNSVDDARPYTTEGTLTDYASSSGERLDTSKSIVMISKGLGKTYKSILNSSPGLENLALFVDAIKGPSE